MTIINFEEVLALPKYEKLNVLISWKDGRIEEKRISNEGKSLFIYGKGRKRYGQREYDFNRIEKIEIKEKKINENEKWFKSWKRAEKILEESGLWKEILKNIEDGLAIGLEKIKKAYDIDFSLPEKKGESYQQKREREINLIKEIDERLEETFIRWHMNYPAKIKKMNFGKDRNEIILEELKEAIKNKKEYRNGNDGKNWNGQSYDTSIEYNPKESKAWYSEEYRGCGNGHYYLALNGTHALFYEDD